MKFTLLSTIGLFGLAIAAPVAEPEASVALESRQSAEAQAYTIVDNLYTEIKQYTGAINTTAAGINADSTAADNATAAATFITNVKAITTAVDLAKVKTDALPLTSIVKRQTDAALAALLEGLLTEVSGALNNIVASLGLSKFCNQYRATASTDITQLPSLVPSTLSSLPSLASCSASRTLWTTCWLS